MFRIQICTWPAQGTNPHPREDVHFVNELHGVFTVADGVTRDASEPGQYPVPSPAAGAAMAAAESIGRALVLLLENREPVTKSEMAEALDFGNGAVRTYSKVNGFWVNHDYLTRDLPGAVAAAAVVYDDEFVWGYIGDCGVARLSPRGDVIFRTVDDVAAARPAFAHIAETDPQARKVRIRRDFRNKPDADHPTYGVLTGEEAAEVYFKVGINEYAAGDMLLVYSDGIAPLIFEDATFRLLLMSGNEIDIHLYVADRSSADRHTDEKTLIIVRTKEDD